LWRAGIGKSGECGGGDGRGGGRSGLDDLAGHYAKEASEVGAVLGDLAKKYWLMREGKENWFWGGGGRGAFRGLEK